MSIPFRRAALFFGMICSLSLGALTMPMTTAHAAQQAPLCSGSGCDGKDPIAMHCNDDQTYTVPKGSSGVPVISHSGQTIGIVELRWSPTCKTNWAKMTSKVGIADMSVRLTDCGGNEVAGTYYRSQQFSQIYGNMKYNTTVRAQGGFGAVGATDLFATTGCF